MNTFLVFLITVLVLITSQTAATPAWAQAPQNKPGSAADDDAKGEAASLPDDPAAADAKATEEAAGDDPVALFQAGKKAYAENDLEGALRLYRRSFTLRPAFDSAGNAGNVASQLKRYALAARYLRWSLDHLPAAMEPKKREGAKGYMEGQLKACLDHVGGVRIEATKGAEIVLDGEALGLAPLEAPYVYFDPGKHTLEARLAGHQPARTTVIVKVGTSQAVTLSPTLGAQPPPGGATPGSDTAPPGGGAAGDPTAEPSGPSVPMVVAGAVLGLGGLAAGGVLMALSAGKESERADLLAPLGANGCLGGVNVDNSATCTQVQTLSEDADTLQAAGIGVLAAGGAITLATGIYLVAALASDDGGNKAGEAQAGEAARLRLTPVVVPGAGGGFGGAVVTGRF